MPTHHHDTGDNAIDIYCVHVHDDGVAYVYDHASHGSHEPIDPAPVRAALLGTDAAGVVRRLSGTDDTGPGESEPAGRPNLDDLRRAFVDAWADDVVNNDEGGSATLRAVALVNALNPPGDR